MESVRKFIELSAYSLNWNKEVNGPSIIWEGEGINEIGRRADTYEIVIRVDKRYFRPTEVNELKGDASKAKKILGWSPKISLEELIKEMIKKDMQEAQKELMMRNKGFKL